MTLQETVKALWIKACEEDGIDPRSPFVVFSKDNKYVPQYEAAQQELLAHQATVVQSRHSP